MVPGETPGRDVRCLHETPRPPGHPYEEVVVAAGLWTCCETFAASAQHIRFAPNGRKLSGGADTEALCGALVLWDTKVPIEAALAETRLGMSCCARCAEKWRTEVGAC